MHPGGALLQETVMFSYFRYVGFISVMIALLGAVAIGVWSNRLLASELLSIVLEQQHANVQSYSETIWRSHPQSTHTNPQVMQEIATRSAEFFKPQRPVKITIFSPDVRVLYYGSNTAYIRTPEAQRVTLFDVERIQRGQTAARILHDASLTSDAPGAPARVVVQAIIPILRAGVTPQTIANCALVPATACTPEALVEVYSDITAQWEKLNHFLTVAGLCILALVLLLALILLLATGRAEKVIAKQHEANAALTEAAAAAESSSRDKSEFLTSVSHELRTPLNAIIGFSDLLKSQLVGHVSKEQNTYMEDISSSGKHLLGLINDILDFSKAEAGKLQLDMTEQDMNKLIRTSMRYVIPRAEAAQITLVEELPSEPIITVTDAKKLKQVLLNLLSNAVKFTSAGGVVRAQLWENVVEKQVIIQISDSGIGIAAKDIPRVLAPFGQVDSKLARKFEGTGLGLPLAKKFIEAMGGKFTLQSEVGVGTVITIQLPKDKARLEALIAHSEGLAKENESPTAP